MMDRITKLIEVFEIEKTFTTTKKINKQTSKLEKKVVRVNSSIDNFKDHLKGKNKICVMNGNKANLFKYAVISITDKITDKQLNEISSRIPNFMQLFKDNEGYFHFYIFFKDFVKPKDIIEELSFISSLIKYNTSTKPLQNYADFSIGDVIIPVDMPFFNNGNDFLFEGEFHGYLKFLDVYNCICIELEELKNISMNYNSNEFISGPPCLQAMTYKSTRIKPEDSQMFIKQSSCFLRKSGEVVKDGLESYNRKYLSQPLKNYQITIRDGKKNYMCNEKSIKPYCNYTECTKRDFGISFDEFDSTFSDLVLNKAMRDRYFLSVNNIRIGPLSLDQLTNHNSLATYIIKEFNIFVKFNPEKFSSKLADLFRDITIVYKPDTAESKRVLKSDVFLARLITFLKEGKKTNSRNELIDNDNLILDDGILYGFKFNHMKEALSEYNDIKAVNDTDRREILDNSGFFEKKDIWTKQNGKKKRNRVYTVLINDLDKI